MNFDRFDICEAAYTYAVLWGHDKVTNNLQSRLSWLGYSPGQSRTVGSVAHLSANGRERLRRVVLDQA